MFLKNKLFSRIFLYTGLIFLFAACGELGKRAYLPGKEGVSDLGDSIIPFWINSWVVLLIVGLIVWLSIIWSSVLYRRRRNARGLPYQRRYHMPLEILFTLIPVVMVVAFFAFTATTQAKIEENPSAQDADVHVEIYGQQWSWNYNYLPTAKSFYKIEVNSPGVQARELRDKKTGKRTGEIATEPLPRLVLPVGYKVRLDLKSRDVAHSFWVPELHYKEDVLPGQVNTFSFTPTKTGEYIAKCAELCGEFHSLMLSRVSVVTKQEFLDYLQSLKDSGHSGRLGDEYNRNQGTPGKKVPKIEHKSEHKE